MLSDRPIASEEGLGTEHRRAYLWLTAAAGALGGLLFGYDWVVIGGAKPFYELYFHLQSPALQGWAMSCALTGCLIGGVCSGRLSDRFGRKRLLLLTALVFAISSLGTGVAPDFAAFVGWRILGGCAIGLASGVCPVYLAEISPAQVRGRLVSLYQLAIVFGILLAQVVNWLIARPLPGGVTAQGILMSWDGQWAWRWMFAATALPSLLFLVATLPVPESPRWLALHGRGAEAFRVFDRLAGAESAHRAMSELEGARSATRERRGYNELRAPGVASLLFLGIALAVLQQWCGINVIFNYAQEIFAAAGYNISSTLFNIVITGAVNAVFTLASFALIDRYGRRVLLLNGFAGLAVIYTVLGWLYHRHFHGIPMLALVLAAIGCYAVSLAPVTWVVIAEIFPNRIRGSAMSIAVTSLWAACFLLTYSFPSLNAALSTAGVFFIYAAICVAGLLYLSLRLPETRGKTLEELEASFCPDGSE